MFDRDSRYADLPTRTHTTPDGREVRYVTRRFLPRAGAMQTLGEVTVTEADRLDLIADRTLGNALHYWRVCDANEAMDPVDLTREPARVLRIAQPKV